MKAALCVICLIAAAWTNASPAQAGVGPNPIDGGGKISIGPITRPVGVSGGYTTIVPYNASAVVGARYLGPANVGTIGVNLFVNMRNEPGLLAYAQLASNPFSPYYRRFLTPAQLADDFGATPQDYARTIAYFQSYGLAVRGWTQRQMIWITGPQAAMERAFGTRFGMFSKAGQVFYAPLAQPRVAIPLPIASVQALDSFQRMHNHFIPGGRPYPASVIGSGFLIGVSPFQLASAFDYTGAYHINANCCKGDTINIGILGTGPIIAADVPNFKNAFHVGGTSTVTQVNVSCCSDTTPPPTTGFGCSGGLPGCNHEDIEAQLDTEQTASLAPNANIVFYLAYSATKCGGPCIGIALYEDELSQAASDNLVDIMSLSIGEGEVDALLGGVLNSNGSGPDPTLFASLAAEGIATFISSGDAGAEECFGDGTAEADKPCVSWPADDVNVVSVGGTTTPIDSNGRLDGLVTAWGVQTGQGFPGAGFGEGGGGVSFLATPRPAWQAPLGKVCSNNGVCDSTHRLQPTLSLNADEHTGTTVLYDSGFNGGPFVLESGGTSESAPDMAAMWALVLEACKQQSGCGGGFSGHTFRLGNPAPLLYGLSPAQMQATFLDVTYGNNALCNSSVASPPCTMFDDGYSAGTGYDLATGLGAPFARNLIRAVTGL